MKNLLFSAAREIGIILVASCLVICAVISILCHSWELFIVTSFIIAVMAIIGGGGWYLLKKALQPLTEISKPLRGYYRAGAFFVIGLFFLLAGKLWSVTFIEFIGVGGVAIGALWLVGKLVNAIADTVGEREACC